MQIVEDCKCDSTEPLFAKGKPCEEWSFKARKSLEGWQQEQPPEKWN